MRLKKHFVENINQSIQNVLSNVNEFSFRNRFLNDSEVLEIGISDEDIIWLVKYSNEKNDEVRLISRSDMIENIISDKVLSDIAEVLNYIFEHIEKFEAFFFRSRNIDILEIYFYKEDFKVCYIDEEGATIREAFSYARLERFLRKNK